MSALAPGLAERPFYQVLNLHAGMNECFGTWPGRKAILPSFNLCAGMNECLAPGLAEKPFYQVLNMCAGVNGCLGQA